ncbi:MAG: hypothetical protein V5A21_05225 [Halapricum sp.]
MSSEDDDAVGRRETAYRLFATEFEESDFSYAESDEERAPNYVVTPTGARVNRLFAVGVLTEVEPVSDDVLRARVVDPTGAFVVYAGQYQPDAQTFLERAEPPTFVAVSGKARTFQPEDSDLTYTSVRPESINEVDAETRDRWVIETAEQTLDRIGTMAGALESDVTGEELQAALEEQGVPEGLASGVPLAIGHYGTGGPYLEALRETALDALRVVAGEREEVADRSVAPDATGEADLSSLADIDVSSRTGTVETETEPEPASVSADSRAGAAAASADESKTVSDEGSAEAEPSGEPTTEETTDAARPSTEDDQPATTDAESEGAAATSDEEDIGDFEPGEFDLDEETREEVESEYGTEFQSGTEVEEPGEADIETPDHEEMEAEQTADTEADSATEQTDAEPAEDVDLEDAVMEAMEALDDGDGADREAVIAAAVDDYGADPGAVEDAIQDALMDGRCYEPDDETLKPI